MEKIQSKNFNFEEVEDFKRYQIDNKNLYLYKNKNNIYIYSYDTCILQLDTKNNILYENNKKYSVTTSKQTGQIKFMFREVTKNYNIIEVTPKHKGNNYNLEKLK